MIINRKTNYYAAFLLWIGMVGIGESVFGQAQADAVFEAIDVFDLEYVSDPQISPDGEWIVFSRNFKDIMTDKNLSNLWMSNFAGDEIMPLTTGNQRDRGAVWSPDGTKLAYISDKGGKPQIYLRWVKSGAEAKLTNFTSSPGNLQWSPDGKWIAFTRFDKITKPPFAKMPSKPAGAKWADHPVFIDGLRYRSDGGGYIPEGYTHIFMLSVDGGHPMRITHGDFQHRGDFSWSGDSKYIVFSANRHPKGEYDPINTEVYEAEIHTGKINPLTNRKGPDNSPVVSPDGSKIAYIGFDDNLDGYQVRKLYLMNRDGSGAKLISGNLDRDIGNIHWTANGDGMYFQYDDQGNTKIGKISLNGEVVELAEHVGGTSLGRPYAGGSFSVSDNGRYAFTYSEPEHPADLSVGNASGTIRRLTNVNADLFSYKKLGQVEEIWFNSSHDGRKVQGWICKPPNFDPTKKYPLLLEIHGGPFSNYGWRFSAEIQLYAAAGYVVLYTNPRGSTSYGKEFGNLIHHNYPGEDYDDLMSGVDAVIEQGYIDESELYITGGSGGGVLTAWTIGHTDRFKAAVVAKPVINWYSFVLHADNIGFYNKYWFPDYPWNMQEHYMKRSPISLVGNVKTPTMLLTGEQDYRTPMSETEQYYAALKLQQIDAAMVRIQNSGHGIASRPSNLIAKVTYILEWFKRYRKG